MDISLTGFYQISIALGEHYDSMYYIDVESEMYMEFLPSKLFLNVPIRNQKINSLNLPDRAQKNMSILMI